LLHPCNSLGRLDLVSDENDSVSEWNNSIVLSLDLLDLSSGHVSELDHIIGMSVQSSF